MCSEQSMTFLQTFSLRCEPCNAKFWLLWWFFLNSMQVGSVSSELADPIPVMDEYFNDGHHSDIVVSQIRRLENETPVSCIFVLSISSISFLFEVQIVLLRHRNVF